MWVIQTIYNNTLQEVYIIVIIIIKRGRQCKAESDIHLISPKTPAPQYQLIDRKKRERKIKDNSKDRAPKADKKTF